MVMLD